MIEKDKEMIEIMEDWAVIGLPPHAIEVNIRVKVYENGELFNVEKKLNLDDIREAFQKAKDGYIDDDDVFVLTEKGKAWAEKYLDNPEE